MVDKTASASPAENTETSVADAVAAASATLDAKDSASTPSTEASDAKPAGDERKLSDVVRDVLQPKEESSTSEDADKTKQETESDGKTEAAEDDKSKDEKEKPKEEDVPEAFHKHPAWQRQLQRARDAEAETARLKPDAEQFQALSKFTKEKGIPHKEVAEAVMLLALIRDNPEKARESLASSVKALDDILGNTLSKDLQEKVETGEMTEAAAQELSRTRAKATREETLRTTTEATRRAAEDTAAQTKAVADLREGVRSKIASWETVTAKSDPDFAKKQELVNDRIRSVLHARGKLFESPEDALTVTKDAYAYVTKRMAPTTAPARRAVTSVQGGGAASEQAAPKTMKDAIAGALSASG